MFKKAKAPTAGKKLHSLWRSLYLSIMLMLVVNMSYLGVFFVVKEASAGDDTRLEITCGDVVINGSTWTFSGTWKAYNFPGLGSQYDVAVFPSLNTTDESSQDSPDIFNIVQGPSDYISGPGNKEDMEGSWSNQYTFSTPPTSVSAVLYHASVPGNESSGDAVCYFTLPACGDGGVNQPSEQCDDANTTSGDGCSATCQIETCVDMDNDEICDDVDTCVATGSEVCDGVDNNCDGTIDEGVKNTYYQDVDGDTYGNPSVSVQACSKPDGYVTDNKDCNDANANVNPGATEICNGEDDNCNGTIDEGVTTTFYLDGDNDGYGSTTNVQACSKPDGYTDRNSDCDDTNPNINPGMAEIINDEIDQNCDGSDEVRNYYWVIGEWGTCNTETGYSTRTISCVYDVEGSPVAALNYSFCAGDVPVDEKPCFKMFECRDLPSYSVANTVTSYEQYCETWDATTFACTSWSPIDNPYQYNLESSTTSCVFKCAEGYQYMKLLKSAK